MIVGLTGYARSGKDTAAEHLFRQYGLPIMGFANKVKAYVRAIDPIVDWQEDEDGFVTPRHLSDLLGIVSEEEMKGKFPEYRRLLEHAGHRGRLLFGENFWRDQVLDNVVHGNAVIKDVRYTNEEDGIHARGGIVVRLRRGDTGPTLRTDHESDRIAADYTIHNDGPLFALYRELDHIMRFEGRVLHGR